MWHFLLGTWRKEKETGKITFDNVLYLIHYWQFYHFYEEYKEVSMKYLTLFSYSTYPNLNCSVVKNLMAWARLWAQSSSLRRVGWKENISQCAATASDGMGPKSRTMSDYEVPGKGLLDKWMVEIHSQKWHLSPPKWLRCSFARFYSQVSTVREKDRWIFQIIVE